VLASSAAFASGRHPEPPVRTITSTMPTGLEYFHGHLYASSWSIASFLGIQHAGKLVQVSDMAFH
jgi:hypothetical protein